MDVIFKEGKKILYGIFVIDVLLIVFSLLLDSFNSAMAMGIVCGSLLTYINFIVMGIQTYKALRKHEILAQKHVVLSYIIRYFCLYGICALLIIFNAVNPIGLLLPLFAPKFVYYFYAIFNKSKQSLDDKLQK